MQTKRNQTARKEMTNSRQTALEILTSSIKDKTLIKVSENADSAFINMLLMTTLRRWADITSILSEFIKKKPSPQTETILHLGATEILEMSAPDYAVINEWVALTKLKIDKYASGFINAVLRKIAQNKPRLQKQLGKHYFTPNYISILKQDYSVGEIAQMEQAAVNAGEPPLALSVKEKPEFWAEKLGGKHLANNTIVIPKAGDPQKLEGYQEGTWWVQDFAATLAVTALGNITGQHILDLCAAPGGKTAQLINGKATVTALDISKDRLNRLQENMQRLKFNTHIICADAVDYLQNYQGKKFDSIILDAPCSATGIFRRHPEILLYKTREDIKKQAALQKQILSQISNALKKGGLLIYCVCSLSKAEGLAQIRNFLKHNSEFKLIPLTEEDIKTSGTTNLHPLINKEGCIATRADMLQNFGGLDSFFIAKLQKVEKHG